MTIRTLLVEDQSTIIAPLVDYFTLRGWQVRAVQEFEEAVVLLETERFDLMIADVRLGGINSHDGLELLAVVRARGLPMRVVLITGYGSPQVKAEATRLGVDALLAKPVALGTLAAACEEALARPVLLDRSRSR